jgi:hypothetical protein
MGEQWYSMLGLGPFPPPEAIRICHRNMANGTTLQSISDVVRTITQETLQSFFHTQYVDILEEVVCAAVIQYREYPGDAQSIPDTVAQKTVRMF